MPITFAADAARLSRRSELQLEDIATDDRLGIDQLIGCQPLDRGRNDGTAFLTLPALVLHSTKCPCSTL
jgi:hypothetical protein